MSQGNLIPAVCRAAVRTRLTASEVSSMPLHSSWSPVAMAWAITSNNMVVLDAPHVFGVPFGLQHLTALPAWFTALMGCEDLLLRLIAVEDVVDPDIQPTFSSQDLGDGHYGLAT